MKFFPLIYLCIIYGLGTIALEDLKDTIFLSFTIVFLFDLTGIIFLPFTVIFIFLIISLDGLLFYVEYIALFLVILILLRLRMSESWEFKLTYFLIGGLFVEFYKIFMLSFSRYYFLFVDLELVDFKHL